MYVIRHPAYVDTFDQQGRKLVHVPETSVSDLGRLQTRQLAAALRARNIRFDAMYSSPYPRAWEMGKILVKELDVPKLYKVDGLKDVFPNSANGKPWDDLEAIGGDIYKILWEVSLRKLLSMLSKEQGQLFPGYFPERRKRDRKQ